MSHIAVGIITYPIYPKRLEYLEGCIQSIRLHLSATRHTVTAYCSCESDDRGDVRAVMELCRRYDFLFRQNPSTPCMGANANNSMRVAFEELSADYLLHLIDDCRVTGPLDMSDEIDFLDAHPETDILRYHWSGRPGACPTFHDRGDAYMQVDPKSIRFYDDSPHIRRANYVEKFGRDPIAVPERAGWVERVTTRKLRKHGANIIATPSMRFAKGGGEVSACH
jgi:hypothetical protein